MYRTETKQKIILVEAQKLKVGDTMVISCGGFAFHQINNIKHMSFNGGTKLVSVWPLQYVSCNHPVFTYKPKTLIPIINLDDVH